MFEPESVQAGIIGLSLLAGETWDDCMKQWKTVAEPSFFTHKPFSGNALYPHGSVVTLASTTVPDQQILIVTYASVYLCESNETVNSIDFGVNHNFYAWWETVVNGNTVVNGSTTGQGQGVINRPVLLVFPSKATVRLRLNQTNPVLPADSRTIECTVTAYSAPAALTATFTKMATQF